MEGGSGFCEYVWKEGEVFTFFLFLSLPPAVPPLFLSHFPPRRKCETPFPQSCPKKIEKTPVDKNLQSRVFVMGQENFFFRDPQREIIPI